MFASEDWGADAHAPGGRAGGGGMCPILPRRKRLEPAASAGQLASSQMPDRLLSQGKGVPKEGVPAVAAMDQQVGNCDSHCKPEFVEDGAQQDSQ